MERKIIVWNLFNDGLDSVGKAIKDEKYEMYNFGISENFESTNKIDLSQNSFRKINDYFDKFPKPDIITASPPCQSFSIASAMKSVYQDKNEAGNACWKYTKGVDILKRRVAYEYEGTRYKADVQIEKARIGQWCIVNTVKLINYYKPKYWYIENPERSLIWKFIRNNLNNQIYGHFNTGWYGSYGTDYKKPTTFFSNVEIDLKRTKKNYISFEYSSKAGIDRSYIPEGIIRDIFKEFK